MEEIWKQAATSGVLLSSMGSPKELPVYWDRLLLNASQVTNPPIDPLREPMETRVFLGKKPERIRRDAQGRLITELTPQLELSMPVLFSAMSYGSISFNAHESLARAAEALGICYNTGEGGLHEDLYGVEEGIVFDQPTIEFSYKNDALGDPLLNTYHALALKLATAEEIDTIKNYAFAVNEVLKAFWAECGVTLVDFKLEFGKVADGSIVLADEISPDTCRLWDAKTHEKLDKDRFRRDLGGVEDAYAEIMKRLLDHDAR